MHRWDCYPTYAVQQNGGDTGFNIIITIPPMEMNPPCYESCGEVLTAVIVQRIGTCGDWVEAIEERRSTKTNPSGSPELPAPGIGVLVRLLSWLRSPERLPRGL